MFRINKNFRITTKQKQYNYIEINKLVKKRTNILASSNVSESDTVAVKLSNQFEFIITVLAIWKLKATPIPLNPQITKDEFEDIATKTCINFLIDQNFQVRIISKLKANYGKSALIMFTSGSTNFPKGVIHSFSNLKESANLCNKIINSDAQNSWLASLPFYHIGGFSIITRSIIYGNELIIPPDLKTDSLIDSIKTSKPNYISLVLTQLKRIIEKNFNFPNETKTIFLGGSKISENLMDYSIRFNLPIAKVYGSTETASMVSCLYGSDLHKSPNSSGKQIAKVKIAIIDENNKKAAHNKCGQIAIKSPTNFLAYTNADKNEKLRNKYYLTGDYGYISSEGFLYIIDRKDNMIISGGENISPEEITKALLEIKGIEDAYVFPENDTEWGQAVSAAIQTKIFTAKEIRNQLICRIAKYKIPKNIYIVPEICRSELGKIQKERLMSLINSSK